MKMSSFLSHAWNRRLAAATFSLIALAQLPVAQAEEDPGFGFTDLVLTPDVITYPAVRGKTFEIRYLVTNKGPLTAQGVRLTIHDHENLGGLQMMDCMPTVAIEGPPRCDLERPLAAGESTEIVLLGSVPAEALGQVELHAFATSAGGYDPYPQNNAAATWVPIWACPDEVCTAGAQ